MAVFKYTSVHQYLDEVFADIDHPTHQEIKQAKRNYWKQYYVHYRREKRKTRKEFTLGFDKRGLELIHQKREQLSVSEFLYACVSNTLKDNKNRFMNTQLIDKLHQQLMELIALVEELLENYDLEINEKLLSRLDNIEEQFLKLQEEL